METVVTQHCTGPNKLATHLGVPLKGTLKGQSPAIIIIINSVKLYIRKYPASWEKYHLLPMPLQEQGSERGGNVPEINAEAISLRFTHCRSVSALKWVMVVGLGQTLRGVCNKQVVAKNKRARVQWTYATDIPFTGQLFSRVFLCRWPGLSFSDF